MRQYCTINGSSLHSCSVDNLRNFAQQFVDGELEPYIKSEPIPEDNDGPVKVRRAMTLCDLTQEGYLA